VTGRPFVSLAYAILQVKTGGATQQGIAPSGILLRGTGTAAAGNCYASGKI